MRDDFSKGTIREIAKGVGYRCSNPDCRRPTVGANAAQDGTIIIGVAAHICAASPGGPRYNGAQTSEERHSKGNGLWLCQNCGRLVDADPDKFTVDTYNIHPAPVGGTRKALFDLLSASPREAALAKRCLIAIDELRDKHGIAAGDTRHPDVMSGQPWPPEAKWN